MHVACLFCELGILASTIVTLSAERTASTSTLLFVCASIVITLISFGHTILNFSRMFHMSLSNVRDAVTTVARLGPASVFPHRGPGGKSTMGGAKSMMGSAKSSAGAALPSALSGTRQLPSSLSGLRGPSLAGQLRMPPLATGTLMGTASLSSFTASTRSGSGDDSLPV